MTRWKSRCSGPDTGVLVHTGEGEWLVVDSCLAEDGEPAALNCPHKIDLDPSTAVKLVVATHRHEDQIRGMTRIPGHPCPSPRTGS